MKAYNLAAQAFARNDSRTAIEQAKSAITLFNQSYSVERQKTALNYFVNTAAIVIVIALASSVAYFIGKRRTAKAD
jgi:hypothetical protein